MSTELNTPLGASTRQTSSAGFYCICGQQSQFDPSLEIQVLEESVTVPRQPHASNRGEAREFERLAIEGRRGGAA